MGGGRRPLLSHFPLVEAPFGGCVCLRDGGEWKLQPHSLSFLFFFSLRQMRLREERPRFFRPPAATEATTSTFPYQRLSSSTTAPSSSSSFLAVSTHTERGNERQENHRHQHRLLFLLLKPLLPFWRRRLLLPRLSSSCSSVGWTGGGGGRGALLASEEQAARSSCRPVCCELRRSWNEWVGCRLGWGRLGGGGGEEKVSLRAQQLSTLPSVLRTTVVVERRCQSADGHGQIGGRKNRYVKDWTVVGVLSYFLWGKEKENGGKCRMKEKGHLFVTLVEN